MYVLDTLIFQAIIETTRNIPLLTVRVTAAVIVNTDLIP